MNGWYHFRHAAMDQDNKFKWHFNRLVPVKISEIAVVTVFDYDPDIVMIVTAGGFEITVMEKEREVMAIIESDMR